jgi:ABC-type nitrate/sulfonate/bicarbonate transport system permease component
MLKVTPNKSFVVSIVSVICFIILWYVITTYFVGPSETLPTPQGLLATFWSLVTEGYTGRPLWLHISTSLQEALGGYVLGILVGTPLGLAMGLNSTLRAVLMPYVDFFRPIPPISLVTLFVLFFGIGLASKVGLIFLSVFWFIILAAADGVRSVPSDLMRAGRNVGMGSLQLFRYVVLPGTMPAIFTGMRTTLSISWALVVAAELVAGHTGLGYMIIDASNFFRLDVVYVSILIIAAFGFAMDRGILAFSRRVLHWQGR